MNGVTKDLLEALKVVTNDLACLIEESGKDPSKDRRIKTSRVAITRAEAELAEPQPDADGWIPWAGGECPVDPFALVVVKYRNGLIDREYCAHQFVWENTGDEDDIVAYCVVEAHQ